VRVIQTDLPGVLIVEPTVHRDDRGFFLETFHEDRYRSLGIVGPFRQDNHSRSVANTIRGLHLQVERPQGKLVRVISGTVWDVAVDVRRGSPTFGRWAAVTLSSDDFRQCYIPPGFAHGFAVLSPVADVEYKCTDIYDPAAEVGIRWNDPQLGISWPVEQPLLSPRDRSHPTLAEAPRLPRYQPAGTQPTGM
jgi:dTDP-4-dehydrorhamnose 3,5-epimerase